MFSMLHQSNSETLPPARHVLFILLQNASLPSSEPTTRRLSEILTPRILEPISTSTNTQTCRHTQRCSPVCTHPCHLRALAEVTLSQFPSDFWVMWKLMTAALTLSGNHQQLRSEYTINTDVSVSAYRRFCPFFYSKSDTFCYLQILYTSKTSQ